MPLPSHVRRSLAALAVALIAVTAAGPVGASPVERQVEAARERLREVRAELERARESRDAEAEALEAAEERVEEIAGAVGAAERAVQRQQRAVEVARTDLDRLTREAEEREAVFRDRVAELYRSGGKARLTGLLTADSPGDLLRGSAIMEVVGRRDRQALEGVAASRRAVGAQTARLEQEQESLERALAQQRELLAEAEQLRDGQESALAEAERRVEEAEGQQSRLVAERRELAAAAERASQPRAGRSRGSSQGSSSSGWRWPASGTVTSEYGPRWGRMHEGIDIAAGHGSAIVAARGGTVSHAGRQGGYGNLVIVDHGGGLQTAYGHLSSISVGVGRTVSAGERLGGMGCTGSCTGTHLHFEVRVNGAARNPRGYLP